MKFIARNTDGEYLTPRRATGRMYESRTTWSKHIEDAKVFNTRTAALNSARQHYGASNRPEVHDSKFEILPVTITILKDTA